MTTIEGPSSWGRMWTIRPALQLSSVLLAIVLGLGPANAAQPSQAEKLLQRASARIQQYKHDVRKTGDKAALASVLNDAYQQFEQAGQAFLAEGDTGQAAACRVGQADALRHLERFDEALQLYAEGEKLAREAGAPLPVAKALIGKTLTRLYGTKDYKKAAITASAATRVSENLSDKNTTFEALCLRCEVDVARGKLASATDWIKRAMELHEEVTDEILLFHAFLDRSDIYLKYAVMCDEVAKYKFCAEMAKLALEDAKAALAIAKKHRWSFITQQCERIVRGTATRGELVSMNLGLHKVAVAVPIFNPETPEQVIVNEKFISTSTGSMPASLVEMLRQWETMAEDDARRIYVAATAEADAGHIDTALAKYLRAIELLEKDYRSLRDVEARGTLIGTQISYYYTPMRYLLLRKEFEKAYRLMAAARSRTLTDQIMTRERVALADAGERALYQRLRKLRTQIAGERVSYERNFQEKPNAPDARALWKEITHLEVQQDTLVEEIRAKAPNLLQLVTSDTSPLSTVQESAARGGYDLLEYVVLSDQVIIWHIGTNGVHVRSVVLPRAYLIEKMKALHGTLIDPNVDFDTRHATELFLFLVQPMLQFVTTEHLVIIPHNELYYVPFQVFQDPANGRFVGERFRVSYAPSSTILQRLHSSDGLSGSAVLAVVGPDLPEALQEAGDIASLYPKGSKVVPRDLATETYLQLKAGGYSVLHVAAHGAFNAREPLLSFVKLTPVGEEDGRLTAAEMFGLPLQRTRLVTLSACETGRVSDAHAGEVSGIPRALLYAGAQSVLLSHWRVDSRATLDWMRVFYREAAGTSLGEAARRAIVALKQRREYSHPYYWGAFYLVGR